VDLVVPKTYCAQQTLLDATQPKGPHYYWKSEFVGGLEDAMFDGIEERLPSITSPMSQVVLFHLAGALSEHAPDDGAVGNRDARYVTAAAGMWPPPDAGRTSEHVAWVRGTWERVLRPYSTGNYINFQSADEGDDRIRASYGKNFDRLAAVKKVVDPDNVFRVNRNVSPK
jgi:hypothetical protein